LQGEIIPMEVTLTIVYQTNTDNYLPLKQEALPSIHPTAKAGGFWLRNALSNKFIKSNYF